MTEETSLVSSVIKTLPVSGSCKDTDFTTTLNAQNALGKTTSAFITTLNNVLHIVFVLNVQYFNLLVEDTIRCIRRHGHHPLYIQIMLLNDVQRNLIFYVNQVF